MLESVSIKNILFLDIETVPQSNSFEGTDYEIQKLWDKKSKFFRGENESASDVYQRAGIYAEFGKIICISVGHINVEGDKKFFRIKSFYGNDEYNLLDDFSQMLKQFTSKKKNLLLCAHNGKEFDFPYIARRLLINGIKLPELLNIAGKKPWEIKHLDTLELWKFGDYKNYTSLSVLTKVFGIPTPKDDIDGSEVAKVYWEDNDIERIVTYCQKDVIALTQLFLKYKIDTPILDENIIII